MATYGPIYANADDGYITGESLVLYTTARSTSTDSVDNGTRISAGQTTDGLGAFDVFRSFVRFDTSPLAGLGTITAVEFGIWFFANNGAEDYAMRVYRYAWASTLAANREANYDGAYGGSATFEGELWENGFAPATGAYVTMAVDPAGINTAGFTGYTLVSDNDVSGIEPTDTQYAQFYASDQAGTSNDPYITITYTPAATGVPNSLMLMGCGG